MGRQCKWRWWDTGIRLNYFWYDGLDVPVSFVWIWNVNLVNFKYFGPSLYREGWCHHCYRTVVLIECLLKLVEIVLKKCLKMVTVCIMQFVFMLEKGPIIAIGELQDDIVLNDKSCMCVLYISWKLLMQYHGRCWSWWCA